MVVLLFAFGIEFSQLYTAAWIQACRETLLGAIFLGSGFVGSDFICYTVGVGLGVLAERIPYTQGPRPNRHTKYPILEATR